MDGDEDDFIDQPEDLLIRKYANRLATHHGLVGMNAPSKLIQLAKRAADQIIEICKARGIEQSKLKEALDLELMERQTDQALRTEYDVTITVPVTIRYKGRMDQKLLKRELLREALNFAVLGLTDDMLIDSMLSYENIHDRPST